MNKIENKKRILLTICKIVSFFLICLSIYELYYENTTHIEKNARWYTDLIEKGENIYDGKKQIWNNLSEDKKEYYKIRLKRGGNRINFNKHLILEHAYNLILNIILFVSLFILNPWVKGYLLFWIVSGIFIPPIYHYLIGYDSLIFEQFFLMTVGMKIIIILGTFFIYAFYVFSGVQLFRIISDKAVSNIEL